MHVTLHDRSRFFELLLYIFCPQQLTTRESTRETERDLQDLMRARVEEAESETDGLKQENEIMVALSSD